MQPGCSYMRDPSLPQLRRWQPCRGSINSSAGGNARDSPSHRHLPEAAHRCRPRHHMVSRTQRLRAGRHASDRDVSVLLLAHALPRSPPIRDQTRPPELAKPGAPRCVGQEPTSMFLPGGREPQSGQPDAANQSRISPSRRRAPVKCMVVGNNNLLINLTTAFGLDQQPYFGGQRLANAQKRGGQQLQWPAGRGVQGVWPGVYT